MILEFVCNIFFGLAGFILSLIPAMPSFDTLNVSFDSVTYIVGFLNNFVSVNLIGACMLIVLVVYNAKFIWSIVMWIVRKIPLGVS